MVLASENERLAARFAPYLQELHEFFTAHRLLFGRGDDLFPFAERIASPGVFRDEMLSMLRSVIFREAETLTQADLLGLLTTAVGGPGLDLTAQKFRAPVRGLLTFIGEALRSLWRRFPDESDPPIHTAASDHANALRQAVDPGVAAPAQRTPRTGLNDSPGRQAGAGGHSFEEVQALPDSYARTPRSSTGISALQAEPKRGAFSRIRALWREPDSPATSGDADSYPEYQPLPIFQPRYRPLWGVGLCGVTVGLAAGLMLRDRPPVPRAPVRQRAGAVAPPALALSVRDSPLKPAPVTGAGPSPDFGAPASPISTFQEDNAAILAAKAALRAANATLPPLPAAITVDKPGSSRVAPDHLPLPELSRTGADVSSETPRTSERKKIPETVGVPAARRLARPPAAPSTQSSSRNAGSFLAPQRAVSHPLPYLSAARSGSQPLAKPSSELPVDASVVRARPYAPAPSREIRLSPPTAYPGEHVYLSASGAMAANLLSAPAPEYPALASASRVQGTVIVQAVVGVNGAVVATRVLSGPQFLRAAALNAVRRWRYRPYLVDGRPAVVATNATLQFQLTQ